jgi:diguanylate cyclase (GGDEF)-like protein
MKLRIGTRYALYTSIVLVLVVSLARAAAGLASYRQASTLRPELRAALAAAHTVDREEALLRSGRYLSNRLFNPLYGLDVSRLNEEIQQVRTWLPVESFLVMDPNGRVLTDGSEENRLYGSVVALPAGLQPYQPVMRTVPGATELFFAVGYADIIPGYAKVTLRNAAFEQSLLRMESSVTDKWSAFWRSLLAIAAITVALMLVLGAVLSWRLSRSLSRPLVEMNDAARQFAAGNLTHRLTIRSNDELGELAASLNQMASELQHRGETLARLANYDVLTGLPNRCLFQDRLAHAMLQTERKQGRLALLFLDLDRFKSINDALGHPAGDELLRMAAARIAGMVRQGDTVARLGGDEFTVLLEGLPSADHAALVADKILRALEPPFALGGRETFVSASIGITLFPDDAADAAGLLRNADSAMYRAKEQGRGNYQFFTAELNRRAQQRHALESSLRGAHMRGEYALHFQPQVCLNSGRLLGAEALLRWRHGERWVPPSEFICVLEETGLIVPVGAWVLEQVCEHARRWSEQGLHDLRLAVNLSARQFQQGNLARMIGDVLSRTGLPAQRLEVEITESTLLDVKLSSDVMDALQVMGVRLSIDDFGTGYSSLSYLQRFSVNTLKIDRSFVHGVTLDDNDAALTAAIIKLAHSLGIAVVAEGVETQAQREFLAARGCNIMQGFIVTHPLPAEAFLAWATGLELREGHRYWSASIAGPRLGLAAA